MEYSKFRFESQVDWIKVQVKTGRTTNVPHLRRLLKEVMPEQNPFVAGDQNSGIVFDFVIQDPASCAFVETVIGHISRDVPVVAVEVLGMEVTLDAYARPGTTRDDLADLVAHLYTYSGYHAAIDSRLYREKAQPVPLKRHEVAHLIAEGWNIARGDHDDENANAQRWYFKTTDNNKQPIPTSEHRARYEVTLRGTNCPVKTLDELRAFDFFQALDARFKFGKAREGLTGVAAVIVAKLDALPISAPISYRRPDGKGRRTGTPWSHTDSDLNLRAKRALVSLTKRWQAVENLGVTIPTPPRFSTITASTSPANTRESGQSPITFLDRFPSPSLPCVDVYVADEVVDVEVVSSLCRDEAVLPVVDVPAPAPIVFPAPSPVVSEANRASASSDTRASASPIDDDSELLAALELIDDLLASDVPASGPGIAQQAPTLRSPDVPVVITPDVRFHEIPSKPNTFLADLEKENRQALEEIDEIIQQSSEEERESQDSTHPKENI